MALEEWRHWLEGAKHPFVVLTDHKNLEYLRTAKRLNSRQARWSLFFSRFQFSISFRPGHRNTKADALSRVFSTSDSVTQSAEAERILPPSVEIAVIRWELDDQIMEFNAGHPSSEDCPPDKTFVPSKFRDRLITWAHSSLSSGHPGVTRTLQLISSRYWWDTMRADVHAFVTSCSICAQCKTPKTLPAGKLMPLPVPERPWSHLAMDFVTDLPVSEGYTTILTVVDRFSRGVKFIPFTALPTAFQTAQAIYTHVFRHFGVPEDILSDRGPQFTSRVWRAFFEHLGVHVSLTSGFHPMSNGQCERVNQELGKFLRIYCFKYPTDWSHYLVWPEIAQNSLINSTSGLTPFQCVLGYQPPLAPWTVVSSDVPAVDDWMNRSERVWEETHRQVSEVLQRYKEQSDKHRGDTPHFQPGDRVWLSTRDFRFEGCCRKLLPKYIGPFRILSQINEVSYRVELPAQYKVNNSFHVSLLKRKVRCWNLAGEVAYCSTSLIGRVTVRRSVAGLLLGTCWILLFSLISTLATPASRHPDLGVVPDAPSPPQHPSARSPAHAALAGTAPPPLLPRLPLVLPVRRLGVAEVAPASLPLRLHQAGVLSGLVLKALLSLPHSALQTISSLPTTLPRTHHTLTSRTHLFTCHHPEALNIDYPHYKNPLHLHSVPSNRLVSPHY
uniref:Gypsy retrotransposon integrase-like protein 1 n=1 Tax=Astyanax mexicanus TaxID=7994 RepID=A0A3B1J2C0_ASTMX